ncbi:MAG: asparagine synthase (glutamine-hydrolyzing), partial [candidate division NC10 bacterium]|nr:asparagine synthase (glutamine-hydrolyzing) [candidate division NC10 bacterium]
VYNGEIYNFPELTRELQKKGHPFRSRSDTEVLLHLYEEEGENLVYRLNGIFAFALWDQRRRRLFLARDRFGAKPLYYTLSNGRLIFASEIKALLAVKGVEPRVSLEALNEYFTFQNLFSDLTLFEGVRILEPGHLLTVEDGKITLKRYWDPLFQDRGWSDEEAVERLRTVFEQAVRRQLVSDVPLGSYLSGGMDSASLVAVASRSIPRLMTFTGGFDLSSVSGLELAFDERKDAELAASTFKTEHYEMVLHAGDLAWSLPRVIWHLEDLRVGMCYQNYYIARLASRFVKVVLSGVGGDELFGGYPWRYKVIQECRDQAEFDQRYYRSWTRLIPDEEKPSFFTPEVWAVVKDHHPFEAYRQVVEKARGLDPLTRALYFEAKTFLHGLLVVEDKLSMAHSLEARVPFLDDELVEASLTIPSRLKIQNGEGKVILRKAMRGLLPEPILKKKKQGFSPPDASWYRGESLEYVKKILLDPKTLERGYFQPASIRRIVEEHLSGRVNHRLLIWSLLCFEWWNRIFLEGLDKEGFA